MANQDETRDIIIKAAQEAFTKYGYRKTTMDDIALATSKVKSAIYYYFKGKEDVFKAVLLTESEQFNKELEKAFKSLMSDPVALLKKYFLIKLHSIKQLENYYGALRDESMGQFDFISEIRSKHWEQEIQTVKQILETGIERKIFKIDEPRTIAIAIVTSIQGIEHPVFLGHIKVGDVEQRLEAIFHLIFNGILMR